MQKEPWLMNLQLFADGGEGGDGAAAGDNQGLDAGAQTGRSRNPEADTLFGVQPEEGTEPHVADGAQGKADPAREEGKKQTFEELLKSDPEFKKAYDQRVKKALDGRFKEHAAMEAERDKMTPILDMLGRKYGISADEYGSYDLDALSRRLMDDDDYYAKLAMEKGLPVEIVKEMDVMSRKLHAMEADRERQQEEEKNRESFDRLVQQAESVKQIYPGFDLAAEMNNQAFGRLVAVGVDARTAYEVAHRDEIMGGAMQYAVQQTMQKASNAIQAGANRPAENGLGGQSAATHVTDPTKMTKAQREELRRRVYANEKIVW